MSSRRGKFGPLIGSIDEGTSSARFLVSIFNRVDLIGIQVLGKFIIKTLFLCDCVSCLSSMYFVCRMLFLMLLYMLYMLQRLYSSSVTCFHWDLRIRSLRVHFEMWLFLYTLISLMSCASYTVSYVYPHWFHYS
jgi:hypothetical protein